MRSAADDATLPLLFAFSADALLAAQVADACGLLLSPLEERPFEDGEEKVRPLVDVRGRDVYVISSLYGGEAESTNDRLCRLLFFIGCLKTNGAARVTAVAPYLCYMRKDRQTKPQDPVTGLYVAQLLEAMGADQVITLEAHNLSAFQNAFRRPTIHLTAHAEFAEHFAALVGDAPTCVVSPDLGGAKRAEVFRALMEDRLQRPVASGFMEKQRSMGKVTGELFAGDVAGRTVLIIDDLISSGTTMLRTAQACRDRGARCIYVCATHAVFCAAATAKLSDPSIDGVVVTDSIRPVPSLQAMPGVTIIPVARILSQAIRRDAAGGR
ncbi:MAG: ribose-phosphate diphosphokinase [Alphaproteobacteria bacterium]|nr:ribose-phosphate diphosphokinase [Alphaproteobacteria bacterium]MBU1552152.1 ribose-phosphate diphosphokinase [Alphaproteobacteria bacterium]MBU2336938.1 ribose-phosphate diphosphokinase [Alphaproteobacteria bacterium]MBU2389695.1 ribose-phosphate diphosphokinase [Alphaproteobacteria bacterium]